MQLTTPRLILRDFQENDYDALRELDRDAETWRYEHPPCSEMETFAHLQQILAWQAEDSQTYFRWAVQIPPHAGLWGVLALTLVRPSIGEYEIGWSLRREEWGKGYASEAARVVLGFAFEHLHAHRVVAFCHSENRASERVMQKLGMTREGRTRQTVRIDADWCDELVYSILEGE
jgi:[ribosomal protein S5]-alanine N-acetyltransferase